jgi:hypothetical protein
VRQTANGADVLVVGSPDVPLVVAALVSSVRPFGLNHAEISVDVVNRIARHASTGKLRRFIPLAG